MCYQWQLVLMQSKAKQMRRTRPLRSSSSWHRTNNSMHVNALKEKNSAFSDALRASSILPLDCSLFTCRVYIYKPSPLP